MIHYEGRGARAGSDIGYIDMRIAMSLICLWKRARAAEESAQGML